LRVLLVWFSRYSVQDSELEKELCEKLMDKFDKKIDFLFIEYDKSKNLGEVERIDISPNIAKYILDTKTLNGTDNETLGNRTDCDKIFQEYRLVAKKATINTKLKTFMVKFICMFVLSKIARKKLRNSLFSLCDI